MVFFVNESVGIENLDADQLYAIYSGQIKNWADVGGDQGKIRVVRREQGDSSLNVLRRSLPGFTDIAITPVSKTVTTTRKTFSVVNSTRGAIGFGPYADALQTGGASAK